MSDHTTFEEMLAAYALDALDASDREPLEAHLQTCAECRMAVRAHRENLVRMSDELPPVQAPAELRSRALRQALAERPAAPGPDNVRSMPSRPTGTPPIGWLAAAAMLVFAVVSSWGYLQERQARIGAEDQARQLADDLTSASNELLEARSLLTAVLAPDLDTTSLAATGTPPSARLFVNRTAGVVVIATFDLPAAPAGRTYQLWGIDTASGAAPLSLGTFDSEADGTAVVSLPLPAGASFDLTAVTEEPAGGSPAPTTTPFLTGAIGGGD